MSVDAQVGVRYFVALKLEREQLERDTVGVEFPEGHRELDRDTLETVALAMLEVRERQYFPCWCERLAEMTAKELRRQNFTHPKLLAYLHGAYLAMEQGVL